MNQKLKEIIQKEENRQQNTLGLIASENFTSKAVRQAVSSVFTNKYSEGYPGKRYYEGNENVDKLERLAIDLLKEVMEVGNEWHANVQVLSGSIANFAIYNAVLEPGDKILAMYLPDGGHLSHGWSFTPESERDSNTVESMVYEGGSRIVSLTSKFFNSVQYKTNPKTLMFDYDFIEELAIKEKPKLLITGGTAYPRDIDYKRMSEIAKKVGAYYLADVSHESGLIAGGALPKPFPYADFVMFTTHKSIRGPRGAVAMCKSEFADKLDRAVFPGLQGGPFNHTIAALVQALYESNTPEFQNYAQQIIKNAKRLGESLQKYGFELVTDGTDKHLQVIDLTNKGILGKKVAKALAYAGIITNKTTVPYEPKSPSNPSGLRIGTPLVTTRGMKEKEMDLIAEIINQVVEISIEYTSLRFKNFKQEVKSDGRIQMLKERVTRLCKQFPLDI